jgi:hypothetical protein
VIDQETVMMYRRLVSLLLLGLFAMTLAGCGEKATTKTDTSGARPIGAPKPGGPGGGPQGPQAD